jgi:hypothetical protein
VVLTLTVLTYRRHRAGSTMPPWLERFRSRSSYASDWHQTKLAVRSATLVRAEG